VEEHRRRQRVARPRWCRVVPVADMKLLEAGEGWGAQPSLQLGTGDAAAEAWEAESAAGASVPGDYGAGG
jgi:hypothetical protein